jgi:hypothetical protein
MISKRLSIAQLIPLTFIINFPLLVEPQLIAGFVSDKNPSKPLAHVVNHDVLNSRDFFL